MVLLFLVKASRSQVESGLAARLLTRLRRGIEGAERRQYHHQESAHGYLLFAAAAGAAASKCAAT